MRHILRLSCWYLILSCLFSVTSYVHGQTASDSPFAEGAHWTYREGWMREIASKGDIGGDAIVTEIVEGTATVKELNATRLVIEHIRGCNYSYYSTSILSSSASSRFSTEIIQSTIDRSALTYQSMAVNSDHISSLVGSPAEEFVSTSLQDNRSVRYWHDLIGSTLSFIATENFTSFHGNDVPVIALHYNGTVIRPIDIESDYLKKLEGSSILNYTINTVCTANFERTTGLLLSLKLKEIGSYSNPLKQRESNLSEDAEYVVENASWEIPKTPTIPNKATSPTQTSPSPIQTTAPPATIQPTHAAQTSTIESDLLNFGLLVVLLIISLPLLEALTSYVRRTWKTASSAR